MHRTAPHGIEDAMDINDLTEKVIGACIEVHRNTGLGLLESAYEQCLCRELSLRGIPFRFQLPLPVNYKGKLLDCGYRVDPLVDGQLLIELKSVEKILPIHEAQLMTYLRLGGWNVGLLINFNVRVLTDGIVRRVVGQVFTPG
jgi:GxxExxY protein